MPMAPASSASASLPATKPSAPCSIRKAPDCSLCSCPPRCSDASKTLTRSPSRASRNAAVSPATPAPMIATCRMAGLLGAARTGSGPGRQPLLAQPLVQHGRHVHAAVGALELLHDGRQQAARGEARGVERVQQLRALLPLGAVAHLAAARLEVARVGGAADLFVLLHARDPDLDIERLGHAGAAVASGELAQLVVQAEVLHDAARVLDHLLQRLRRVLGAAEL